MSANHTIVLNNAGQQFAENRLGAKLHAEEISKNNEGLYSKKMQRRAVKLYCAAMQAYDTTGVYLNYRQKFITIKVTHKAGLNNKKEYRKFHELIAEYDGQVVITRTGTLVRLMNPNYTSIMERRNTVKDIATMMNKWGITAQDLV